MGVIMGQYLLSTYRAAGDVPGAPTAPEETEAFMERVMAVEEALEAKGSFVFGGALVGEEAASVVDPGEVLVTDGPFAESKESRSLVSTSSAPKTTTKPGTGRACWPRRSIIRSRFARSPRPDSSRT